MARIIEGTVYERKRVHGMYEVRTKRCGRVFERTIRPMYAWEESRQAEAWELVPYDEPDPIKDAEWLAEQKAKDLRRAAERAKLACKWFIVNEGFDELLTLTYRENQTDEVLAKEHHKEWVRRMKRAIPSFRYCTGFEPQTRGAWHMHVATHKLPQHADYKGVKIQAWRLGTLIWRDIVGQDNGLCFVGGKPSRWGRKRRNLGLYKMANYVSKYIIKHYDLMPDGKNRYSRSNGQAKVDKEVLHFPADAIGDLIGMCFEVAGGHAIVSHRLSRSLDFWILATEGPPG